MTTNRYPDWTPTAHQRCFRLVWKTALINAVSELFSAFLLWISAFQRWIRLSWKIDENDFKKFGKVLGSRKTRSFGVFQLWKKSFSPKNFFKNFNGNTCRLPHAPWPHVTCITDKQLKYKVLSKKWADKGEKSCKLRFFTSWRLNMTTFEQPWTTLKQLWFSEWQLKETALNGDDFFL